MQTMNVALPDSLTEYVEQQIVQHGFASASDYIRELVQADQRKKERQVLEAEVLRGMQCKERIVMTDEVWESMRQELQARLAAKSKSLSSFQN